MCGKQGAFMGHKMQKVNLSEQIVDAMIQYIEDGKWSVGEKLPNEMELAEYFGVWWYCPPSTTRQLQLRWRSTWLTARF